MLSRRICGRYVAPPARRGHRPRKAGSVCGFHHGVRPCQPVEHVSFTFALGGVSRALTHQLVRHRIASYSQQSQRYVDGSDFDYLIPPEIRKNPEALARFEGIMSGNWFRLPGS